MTTLRYASGEAIRGGDRVRIKRFLRPPLDGVVVYVFDASAPALREINDRGVAIRVSGGRELWYGGAPGAGVSLIARQE